MAYLLDKLPTVETPAVDEVGRVMLRAAFMLRAGGWCQRRSQSETRHCAAMAIIQAAAENQVIAQAAIARLASRLPHRSLTRFDDPDPMDDIIVWNDAKDRTAAEVIAALESASHNR